MVFELRAGYGLMGICLHTAPQLLDGREEMVGIKIHPPGINPFQTGLAEDIFMDGGFMGQGCDSGKDLLSFMQHKENYKYDDYAFKK